MGWFIFGVVCGIAVYIPVFYLLRRNSDRSGIQDSIGHADTIGNGLDELGESNQRAEAGIEIIEQHNKSAKAGIRTIKRILEAAKKRSDNKGS